MLTQIIKYAIPKMNKYVGASFLYGFARSVGPVNNLKNTTGKEMHPVTKIAVISYATVTSPVHLPIYIYNDLKRVKHPKKTVYDIIFT
jgi:hypothetical protein